MGHAGTPICGIIEAAGQQFGPLPEPANATGCNGHFGTFCSQGCSH